MKKVFAILFILAISISLIACSQNAKLPIANSPDTNLTDLDSAIQEDGIVFKVLNRSMDETANPTFEELTNSGKFLNAMKKYNQALHSNFDYIEYGTQYLIKLGEYEGDTKFAGGGQINIPTYSRGESTTFTYLLASQVDRKINEQLEKYISSGRNFSDEDFTFGIEDFNSESRKNLPVILGKSYEEFYSTGDIMEGYDYEGTYFDLEVVGFLVENAGIVTDFSEKTLFNNTIVMPSFDIRDFEDIEFYKQKNDVTCLPYHYIFQKNSGYILTNNSEFNFKDEEEEYQHYYSLTELLASENGFHSGVALIKLPFYIN